MAGPPSPVSRRDVAAALEGDGAAMRGVLAVVVPAVRVAVARALYRYRGYARRRTVEQEAEDLTQEVLACLFEDGGRVIAAWDPARGLDLGDFASFVAARTAGAVIKSGRRTPWRDEPTAPESLADARHEGSLQDVRVASMDLARRIYEALEAELSPMGLRVFERLFLDDGEVDSVCAELEMSRNAVYAWRFRLAKRVRELAAELEASVSRIPVAGEGR